jgi:hypothetical protein
MLSCKRRTLDSLKWVAILFVAAGTLEGCNQIQSEEAAVNEYYKNNQDPKAQRLPVARVAGRILVDGQPPAQDAQLFVVLYDPQHLEKPGDVPKLMAKCDAEGNFAFTSYVTGDGVPNGKYVVTCVALRRVTRATRGLGARPGRQQEFIGPDVLKNLYSDPEKNKDDPTFIANVEAPGRNDYEFQLVVAGKQALLQAGQYAVTRIKTKS